jgi:hypothetical protein
VKQPAAQDSPLARRLHNNSWNNKHTRSPHAANWWTSWSSVGRVLVECVGGTGSARSSRKPRVLRGFHELVECMGGSLVECWLSFGRVCGGVFFSFGLLIFLFSSVWGCVFFIWHAYFFFVPRELLHSAVGRPPPMLCHAWPAAGRRTPTALADRRHSIVHQTAENIQRPDTWSKQFALPGHF